jgi:hypothetical protein
MQECIVQDPSIQYKAKDFTIKNLPLTSQTYAAPIYNNKNKRVGTDGSNHNVG